MKYQFLNKVQTPDMINLTIKKVFDEQTSDWEGKQTRRKNCLVEWNGALYYSKFTPKYYPIAIEGNKVSAVRKVMNGSDFFEYYSGGDGMTPNPSVDPDYNQAPAVPIVPPMPTEEFISQKPPVNFPARGACFNLAFQYCLEHKITEQPFESFEQFMNRVEETAKKIVPYQDKFVNVNYAM